MKDADYEKAIEIYRSLYEQAKAFKREFDERIEAEYGEGAANCFNNPFTIEKDMFMSFPDAPSKDAVYRFDNKNTGSKFYELKIGDFLICECVQRSDSK